MVLVHTYIHTTKLVIPDEAMEIGGQLFDLVLDFSKHCFILTGNAPTSLVKNIK